MINLSALATIVTIGASIISFYGLGLQQAYWQFLVNLVLSMLVAMSHAMLYGVVASSFVEAATLGTVHTSILACASGLLGPTTLMPQWIRWFHYVSPQGYSIHAFLTAEYQTNTEQLSCDPSRAGMMCFPFPVVTIVDELTIMGEKNTSWGTDMLALGVYGAAVFLLTYIPLHYMHRRR